MKVDFDKIDIYELWLALKTPSAKRFSELTEKYGNPKEVFESIDDIRKNEKRLITDSMYHAMSEEPPEALYEKMRRTVNRLEIDVILKSNELYPSRLKQCHDSPQVLFVRGTLPDECRHTVGIVGTRKDSNYGAEITDAYAYECGRHGIVVVSGMARGIDSIAARSALRASDEKCATVAVLGSGVDVPTPKTNKPLYERIIERGAVVSQFAPGVLPTYYTYPKRNKVIAGLSDVLIVAEAGEGSGALITADASKEYNRPVFCVPGRMSDSSYAGTNRLISSGNAKHISPVDDFVSNVFGENSRVQLDLFNEALYDKRLVDSISFDNIDSVQKESDIKDAEEKMPPGLDEAKEKIYNALRQGRKSFDELCAATDLMISELNLNLTLLELSGIIVQLPGRVYKLR